MNAPDAEYPPLPDKRYFAIGEAARLALTKPHTVRYWEKRIAPLARVARHNGSRRYYTRDDVLLLRKINDFLGRDGYTIDGVCALLAGGKNRKQPPGADWQKVRRDIEHIIALL